MTILAGTEEDKLGIGEMSATPSDHYRDRFNTASVITEELGLLHIGLDSTEIDHRPGRDDTPQSRNVMRKQQRWERRQAAKKSKRKEEKMKRKQNRKQEPGTDADHPQLSKRVMKAITKERLTEAQANGPKLCVDLSMTDCMSDKEICRLAGQIRRLYGSNRRACRPFHLYLTHMSEDSRLARECLRMNSGFQNYLMDMTDQSCLDLFPPEDIIYLSPDAEEALERLEVDKVYILGGLVDESIQKKMSYLRAREMSVRTAKLPVDEYMVKKDNPKNFHSNILAINQVFDILSTFYDTGSWSKALGAWFPVGKGFVLASEAANVPLSGLDMNATMNTE